MKNTKPFYKHIFGKDFWLALVEKAQFKRAVKIGITAGIAFFVGIWFSEIIGGKGPDKLIGGLWCSLSAIIIAFESHLGNSFKSAWIRLLGTLIGAFLGGGFALLLGADPLALGISVAVAVIICSLVKLRSSILLTLTTLTIVIILWKLDPSHGPWVFALFRFIDAFLGTIVAVLVAFAIWPEKGSKKIQKSTSEILSSIHRLYQMIVLEREREEIKTLQKFYQEIEKHLEENFLLIEDVKFESYIPVGKLELWELLHDQLRDLRDSIHFMLYLNKKSLNDVLEHSDESIKKLIEEIDIAFLELMRKLEEHDFSKPFERMKNYLNEFKKIDLRGQGQTENLETFYTFAFIQKEIAETIVNIDQTSLSINGF